MTTIRRAKLPGGVWAIAWRDEQGNLVIVFAENASAQERKAAAGQVACLARRLGWGTGVIIPAAWPVRAAAHSARMAAVAAGAAGITLTVAAGPAIFHTPAHASTPPGRAPAPVAARAVSHARGRRQPGRHAAPAQRSSGRAAVPAAGTSPGVSASAGVTTPGVKLGPVTIPSLAVPVNVSVPLPQLPGVPGVPAGICADVALLEDEPALLKTCVTARL